MRTGFAGGRYLDVWLWWWRPDGGSVVEGLTSSSFHGRAISEPN